MKLSLRWISDHIQSCDWQSIDIDQLVADFNAKVAEIEHTLPVTDLLPAQVAAGRVIAREGERLTLTVPEWGEQVTLKARSDLPAALHADAAFLLRKTEDGIVLLSLKDLGLEKDGLLAALAIKDDQLAGDWRAQWENDDLLLDVDNKSITHRPDMWGHRGFAREIAALLGKKMKDEAPLLADLAVQTDLKTIAHDPDCKLTNQAPDGCAALAGLAVGAVNHVPCDVRTVSRFAKIDYRPINGLVDATNYVMADWGQPMHAYDADRVDGNQLTARMAQKGEELVLLDQSTLTLNENDIVVTDSGKILGLAGIMGGKDDSIGDATSSVLLESGCWHAASVRRTAARHKLRTESSQRYEKTLDPAMTVQAIARFMQVALEWGVVDALPHKKIQVVGSVPTPLTLLLPAAYVNDRLGFDVTAEQVTALLTPLAFEVAVDDAGDYQVTIPTFRSSKDVTGPHDLVEEIARQYGFDTMTPVMPSLPARASDIRPVLLQRQFKQFLAYGARMREQRNYAFYDQAVLEKLAWPLQEKLVLKNPVSQQARCLIDSLLPHLFGNVMENMADHESFSFFEWGTVWDETPETEHYQLAGVWYQKRGGLDFYSLKQIITDLCRIANVELTWQQAGEKNGQPWLDGYRGAVISVGDKSIGHFGKVNPLMVQRMGGLPETELYAFSLDGTFLQSQPLPAFNASGVRKHQHSTFDVSVMIPLAIGVAELEREIAAQSELVVDVRLIDFFEKKEWNDQRSVALRVTLSHDERTVSREENEQVRQLVIAALQAKGGELRA